MKRKQTHLLYGTITGLALILVYFVVYKLELDSNPGLRYIAYVPFAIGIILNGITYSRQNSSKVTYSNVFGSCFKASLVVTVLSVVWVIILAYTDPSMKVKYMDIAKQSLTNNPNVTDEMMAANLEMMSKAYVYMMVLFTALYDLLAGLVFSLIGAAIAKKSPEQHVEME